MEAEGVWVPRFLWQSVAKVGIIRHRLPSLITETCYEGMLQWWGFRGNRHHWSFKKYFKGWCQCTEAGYAVPSHAVFMDTVPSNLPAHGGSSPIRAPEWHCRRVSSWVCRHLTVISPLSDTLKLTMSSTPFCNILYCRSISCDMLHQDTVGVGVGAGVGVDVGFKTTEAATAERGEDPLWIPCALRTSWLGIRPI